MQTHPEPSNTAKPTVWTCLVADVKCYLCGGISGTVESEKQPMPRSVTFRKVGEQQPVRLLDWHQLRCARCSGPVYLDDADVITRRVEQHNWLEDQPRRGRPPKRVAEERRRHRQAAEHQAA